MIENEYDRWFSGELLVSVCSGLQGRRAAALLVGGRSSAAATAALAAARAGLPVLRAPPTNYAAANNFKDTLPPDIHPLEVRLETTARETFHALRSLLLHTHWHSFTVLAEAEVASSLALRKDLSYIISSSPLLPKILALPPANIEHALFRRLADVSRSTRGVIVLISDAETAQRVLQQAKRLNMLDGHFVWLWIDTTSTMNQVKQSNQLPNGTMSQTPQGPDTLIEMEIERRAKGERHAADHRERHGLGRRPDDFDRYKRDESAETGHRDINHSFNASVNSVVNKRSDFIYSKIKNEGVESSKMMHNSKYTTSAINDTYNNIIIASNSDEHNNYNESSVYIGDGVKFVDSTYSSVSEMNRLSRGGLRVAEKRAERLWAYNRPSKDDAPSDAPNTTVLDAFPVGLLALRPVPMKTDRQLVRGAVRTMGAALRRVLSYQDDRPARALFKDTTFASCWTDHPPPQFDDFSDAFVSELHDLIEDSMAGKRTSQDGNEKLEKSLVSSFEILNLVPDSDKSKESPKESVQFGDQDKLKWRSVGHIIGRGVQLDTIVWPGGDIVVSGLSAQARSVFRIVTALAPPFVMESELDEDGQCLRGLPCHRVLTSDKDNLTLVFNEMDTQERMEEEAETDEHHQGSFFPHLKYEPFEKLNPFQNKYKYRTNCCYGLTMDLLENIAQELEFDFHLYIVSDGLFGTRKMSRKYTRNREYSTTFRESNGGKPDYRQEFRGKFPTISTKNLLNDVGEQVSNAEEDMKWNGLVGDLVSGAAHMSFAALSVSSARSEVIDFSAPYFFSGVSFLAAPQQKSEIPLLAFLLPFSPELWIAIFTSLNVTAIAVAIYEWLSPFGLNPWGRQRSKNFSMSSALWVMWGLLCGHLVAFKAPKSWPNKFLINVWGGFSVIFVASYTANIAALIAGLFFHNAVDNYHDRSLLSQRVGAPKASASEYYVQRANDHLWDHMKRYALADVEDGIRRLRNGSLDLLIADTPVLDYYRATDHGCKLQRIGDTINEDTYAIGMAKGFPLKDSISALISKYSANGYMDILQEKWYGGLPCFKLATDYGIQPRPLGVAAVAGVFILLGVGMAVGCLILLVEHLFYRYTLPLLRHKPKGTIWRSRNIMFFSQKLYRFINCVELVSPHHAARELVHTLRQGQITSLFQKSVKRKEHEQRRRRKSKAQFFEMIQEIRRVQQEERDQPLESVTEIDSEPPSPPENNSVSSPPKKQNFLSFSGHESKVKSPLKSKLFSKDIFKSPRAKNKKRKQSASGLNVRRFSTDSVFSSNSMLRFETTSVAIGRRLSKDTSCLTNSPPDINSRRSSYMDFSNFGSRSPNVSSDSLEIGKKLATIPKYKGKQFLDSSPNEFSKHSRSRPPIGWLFGANNDGNFNLEARSFQNVSGHGSVDCELETSNSAGDLHSKPDCPQLDLQKKHKKTFEELQEHLNSRGDSKKSAKVPVRRCFSQQTEGNGIKGHHQIKIQIEDHSSPSSKERYLRQRHRSLESEDSKEDKKYRPRTPECFPKDTNRKTLERTFCETAEGGRDLSIPTIRSRSGSNSDQSCRSVFEDHLPPAPPYPNVAPRNSDGKSPLERLTKDELVLLWRSSESELRSHLLTALREKENSEPP
ncbi:uncharacterized protein LOC143916663 [Arctopsyche grandis]|uniref:uncharacterized protein LOC143916663 n=1 Tax=Arctopsyche grandis TaxID=121162 RepID=UPI00406DA0A8